MALALRLLEGGPALIQRAATQTLVVEVGSEASRERLAVSSGTVSLYGLDSTLVSAAALTPSGVTDGRATYSLAAASVPATLPLGPGYRLVWTVVAGGVTSALERDAILCRQVPAPTVTAQDLYARHPDLAEQIPPVQATSGVGWAPQIDAAYREVCQRLSNMGRRHELIWSKGSLHEVHLYTALAIIYTSAITRIGDSRYQTLADRYHQSATDAWNALVFDYSPDEDPERGATQAGQAMISAHLGPRRSTFGWPLGRGW